MPDFALVRRHTGLRIRNVVTLERNGIDKDGKLYFCTAKTGTPIFLPLPKIALDVLKGVPNLVPFCFWTRNPLPFKRFLGPRVFLSVSLLLPVQRPFRTRVILSLEGNTPCPS